VNLHVGKIQSFNPSRSESIKINNIYLHKADNRPFGLFPGLHLTTRYMQHCNFSYLASVQSPTTFPSLYLTLTYLVCIACSLTWPLCGVSEITEMDWNGLPYSKKISRILIFAVFADRLHSTKKNNLQILTCAHAHMQTHGPFIGMASLTWAILKN